MHDLGVRRYDTQWHFRRKSERKTNSDYNFWVGMFAPAKTPSGTVNRLYRETIKALNLPDVREKLARLGAEPMDYNPEQFNAYLRAEIASNAALVKAAGIKAQ